MRHIVFTFSVLCAIAAFPAAAQVGDPEANARCFAVAEELSLQHDKATEVYNRRNAAYNANPNPDEAKRLDAMAAFLDKMQEASLSVRVYYSDSQVPQAIRDEVKAKKPGELIAMAKACVAAETARIAKAQ